MSVIGYVSVISQEALATDVYSLTIESPTDLSAGFEPGQFLHFRVTDSFDLTLRRPLSLCAADVQTNQITVVYRAQGEGTKRLTHLIAGDHVDVLGPLGHGFIAHEGDKKVLLIGGGIGVPPLVQLARQFHDSEVHVVSALGFATQAQAILLDELSDCGSLFVASEDGSLGQKGFVTHLLTEEFCSNIDRYYACGPTPMLKAVQHVMNDRKIPGYLSLEERMGCGIGICVGCVHPIARDEKVTNRKTCKEGPVFLAEEVIFDE